MKRISSITNTEKNLAIKDTDDSKLPRPPRAAYLFAVSLGAGPGLTVPTRVVTCTKVLPETDPVTLFCKCPIKTIFTRLNSTEVFFWVRKGTGIITPIFSFTRRRTTPSPVAAGHGAVRPVTGPPRARHAAAGPPSPGVGTFPGGSQSGAGDPRSRDPMASRAPAAARSADLYSSSRRGSQRALLA